MDPITKTPVEFRAWGKVPRLNRHITITEKIDGTNGAIGIVNLTDHPRGDHRVHEVSYAVGIYAQSRTRIITPDNDNHGFARWVWDNGSTLVSDLGPGLHFGEWWGSGINRGYGLTKGEKFFSLFNTERWLHGDDPVPFDGFRTENLKVVPVISEHDRWEQEAIDWALSELRGGGSFAFPAVGYGNPEGIVVYHKASRMMFKVTLVNDDQPKGQNGG